METMDQFAWCDALGRAVRNDRGFNSIQGVWSTVARRNNDGKRFGNHALSSS